MFGDFCLLSFALWLSFSLRYNTLYIPSNHQFAEILLLAPVCGIITFFFMGIYKTVTRFMFYSDILKLHLAIILSVIIWGLLSYMVNNYEVIPRSVLLSYMFFALFFLRAVRWLAAFLLRSPEVFENQEQASKKEILIYGAGVTGMQLAKKLSRQGGYINTSDSFHPTKKLSEPSICGKMVF